MRARGRHESGDPADRDTEYVEINPGDLSGMFAPPAWLRDLGVMAWLLVGVTGMVIATVWLLSLTQTIVMPVVTAVILASVLGPLVRWLGSRGIPRGAGAAIVLLGVVVAGAAIVALVLGGISAQAGGIESQLKSAASKIGDGLENLGVSAPTASDAKADASGSLSSAFQFLLGGIGAGLRELASLAVFLSFTVLSLFFLLKDGPVIRAWLERHLGVPHAVARTISGRMIGSLRGYFAGVTAVAVFNGVVIGLGALILGVPLAGSIAVINFVAAYIPYLGAWTAGAFTVLIALGDGGPSTALAMAVIIAPRQRCAAADDPADRLRRGTRHPPARRPHRHDRGRRAVRDDRAHRGGAAHVGRHEDRSGRRSRALGHGHDGLTARRAGAGAGLTTDTSSTPATGSQRRSSSPRRRLRTGRAPAGPFVELLIGLQDGDGKGVHAKPAVRVRASAADGAVGESVVAEGARDDDADLPALDRGTARSREQHPPRGGKRIARLYRVRCPEPGRLAIFTDAGDPSPVRIRAVVDMHHGVGFVETDERSGVAAVFGDRAPAVPHPQAGEDRTDQREAEGQLRQDSRAHARLRFTPRALGARAPSAATIVGGMGTEVGRGFAATRRVRRLGVGRSAVRPTGFGDETDGGDRQRPRRRVVGTAAMTLSSTIEMKMRGRDPSTVPAVAAGKVLGVAPAWDREQRRFAVMVHWGYGTGLGVLRGFMGTVGIGGKDAAALFFAIVWTTELLTLPALDIGVPPAWRWGVEEIAIDGLHHVVYSAATSAACDLLEQHA